MCKKKEAIIQSQRHNTKYRNRYRYNYDNFFHITLAFFGAGVTSQGLGDEAVAELPASSGYD
jgi:hypothetical protein